MGTTSSMLAQEFHPTLDRAGLRQVRFHDLRHTYAALQIALGENFKFQACLFILLPSCS